MKSKYIICYHGTTDSKFTKIVGNGFKADSWFARHLEDAVNFGGDMVLAVEFERDKVPHNWQFHVLEEVPKTRILRGYRVVQMFNWRDHAIQ